MQIELRNFSYSYKEGFSLDSVSLSVGEGESIAIMGANGSGKTTLLKVLAGIIEPSSGSIEISKGSPISIDEYYRKLGYLTQSVEKQLFSSSLLKEIAYPLKRRGYKKRDIEQIARKVLDDTGLDYIPLERNPFTLSGGERRRAAIALSLSYEPEVLLFDEPTSGMDWKARKSFCYLLDNLRSKSIVIVTHDVDIALKMDRLVVMDGGRIIYDGPSSALLDKTECSSLGIEFSDSAFVLSKLEEKGLGEYSEILKEELYGK